MRRPEDTDAVILYELNDAISQVCADRGLLDRWDSDEADTRLDDACYAAFDILTGRSDE